MNTRTSARPLDAQICLRVSSQIKSDFEHCAKALHMSTSDLFRAYIQQYVCALQNELNKANK